MTGQAAQFNVRTQPRPANCFFISGFVCFFMGLAEIETSSLFGPLVFEYSTLRFEKCGHF